jgi:hypothetical protein
MLGKHTETARALILERGASVLVAERSNTQKATEGHCRPCGNALALVRASAITTLQEGLGFEPETSETKQFRQSVTMCMRLSY